MPKRLTKEDFNRTETDAKFIAEPFETGYGHTLQLASPRAALFPGGRSDFLHQGGRVPCMSLRPLKVSLKMSRHRLESQKGSV